MYCTVAPSAFLHPAAMTSPFTAHKSRPRCASEEERLAKENAVENLLLVYFGITLSFDSRYLLLFLPFRSVPAVRFSVPGALLRSLQECPCH